ncbi:hypothetical protein AVEN_91478-1 [Araneus ventricosus]|uniref:ATP-dependent DNA helicase n=1 Tax=Araneus ventricosus TaxID=182803 RepID=A0A4Y2BLL3_ARAVE|nr:hypothetical protein AVEN_91478-1 [Araneus ventricosus]
MYVVNVKHAERFYLRMLLLHVPGATSYKFLRTVDNIIYDIFKQVAFHHHFLNSDEEWHHCLHDASTYQMPKQLRQTFAFILCFCNPSSIGLPVPTGNAIEVQLHNQDDEREEAEQRISSLNREQLVAFETFTRAIGNNNENDSGFKLPVHLLYTSVSSMRPTSPEADKLRQAVLIIIDEITMLTKDGLRCIDSLLRDLMNNDKPFGDKVIIIGGDFRQTLPVVPRGTRASVIES